MSQKDEMVDLSFRPAISSDSEMLLRWRNDPVTVAMSRVTQPVSRCKHQAWLGGVLEDDRRIMLIATKGEEPVGTVRFDKKADDEFEISITVKPQSRGKGLGGVILLDASDHAFKRLGILSLFAAIHEENGASRHVFEQAGYRFCGTVAGIREYRLIR